MEFVSSSIIEGSAVKNSYGEQEKADEEGQNCEPDAKYISGLAAVAREGMKEQDDAEERGCRCAGIGGN
jgi:hypothetical protein